MPQTPHTQSHIDRDPICGMLVDPKRDKRFADHGGRLFHFCSDGCRAKFVADPDAYLIAQDPVCGISVDRASAQHMAKRQGERFYFCAEQCQAKFEAAPDQYLAPRKAPEPAIEGVLYTCPMDPEIIRDAPADCPICGMALEPMLPSVDQGPNPELIDFRQRMIVGAPLALAVFVLEMGGMMGLPWASLLGVDVVRGLQFALASPVVLWIGGPFFKRGWSSIVTGNLNMWTLIAIGTGAAYAFSVVSFLAPSVFPASLQGAHGPPLYFEAASVILVLVLVGQVLELSARDRTGDAIRALMDLAPQSARR